MNREILFRGKRKDNSEWAEGYLLIDTISGIYAIVTYVNLNGDLSDLSEINIYEVIPETVGQFTGLTDKNGNRIFEGDILKNQIGELWQIKYGCDCGGFIGKAVNVRTLNLYAYELLYGDLAEIVGNIHDNPQLLL